MVKDQTISNFVRYAAFNERLRRTRDKSFPKISIVTPSYNQGQFLEETILSVLNQNYPNLEYIVIDGGSTDGSVELLKKYEPWLDYWETEPDGGQAEALVKGFGKATGDILAWQNSDDIFMPDAFKKAAREFSVSKGVDLVFGNIYLIDRQTVPRREIRYVSFSYQSLLHLKLTLSNQAAFWRRKLFLEYGDINPAFEYCMDLDFWVRIGKSARIRFIREFLGCARLHGSTKTATRKDVAKSEIEAILHNASKRPRSFGFWMTRQLMIMRKLVLHIWQGELTYVCNEVSRRIRARLLGLPYDWSS